MKKLVLAGLVAALALVPGWIAGATSDDVRTFKGSYVWDQGKTDGPLTATFTPAEEGGWNVSFSFEFRGDTLGYEGTATGSLDNGSLSGRVDAKDIGFVYTFTGMMKDGAFEGTHAQVEEGGDLQTGTLEMR